MTSHLDHGVDQCSTMSRRIAGLDVLRAIAVFLVITNHVATGENTSQLSMPIWLQPLHQAGWVGVDLFFVLSGFLVSGLLFDEFQKSRTIHVRRFLIRRGFKIYPGFYVFFLSTLALIAWQSELPTAQKLWGELLFLQNYWGRLWNHTWTLAVEEHFYLGIAVVIGALASRPVLRPLAPLPILLVTTCVLIFFLRHDAYDGHWQSTVLPSHLRADSLAFGVLISYGWSFHHAAMKQVCQRFRWWLLVFGCISLSPAFFLEKETSRWLVTSGLTVLYLGAGAILLSVLSFSTPRTHTVLSVIIERLARIGFYSYSIYLWHMPVIWWLTPGVMVWMGLDSVSAEWLISLPLCVVVGIIMAELVEMPTLALRERYFPRSGTAPQLANMKQNVVG